MFLAGAAIERVRRPIHHTGPIALDYKVFQIRAAAECPRPDLFYRRRNRHRLELRIVRKYTGLYDLQPRFKADAADAAAVIIIFVVLASDHDGKRIGPIFDTVYVRKSRVPAGCFRLIGRYPVILILVIPAEPNMFEYDILITEIRMYPT